MSRKEKFSEFLTFVEFLKPQKGKGIERISGMIFATGGNFWRL